MMAVEKKQPFYLEDILHKSAIRIYTGNWVVYSTGSRSVNIIEIYRVIHNIHANHRTFIILSDFWNSYHIIFKFLIFYELCVCEETSSILNDISPTPFFYCKLFSDKFTVKILKYLIHIFELVVFQAFVSYFKDVHSKDNKSMIVDLGRCGNYQW